MRFSAIFALSVVSVASAANFNVIVGENSGLTYNPTSVTAAEGDTITFEFTSKNHTLTQSTFTDPCVKMTTPAEGIDSGFVPVTANATSHPVWSMTVNNASTPLWFYCAQVGHCVKGMVFAVNPTAAKSFAAFQAAAMGGSAATNTTTGTTGATTAAAGSAGGVAGAAATSSAAGASASTTGNGASGLSAKSALLLVAAGVAGMLL